MPPAEEIESPDAKILTPESQVPLAPVLPDAYRPNNRKHLSKRQIAKILSLVDDGHSQREVAALMHVHESSVSRVLDEWADTRPIARRLLERGAEKLASTVVRTKDSAIALKALGKLDVVREDQAAPGSQLLIQIGTAQAADPLVRLASQGLEVKSE